MFALTKEIKAGELIYFVLTMKDGTQTCPVHGLAPMHSLEGSSGIGGELGSSIWSDASEITVSPHHYVLLVGF